MDFFKKYSSDLFAIMSFNRGEFSTIFEGLSEMQRAQILEPANSEEYSLPVSLNEIIGDFENTFGEPNFFVEICDHKIPHQTKILKLIGHLSRKYRYKILATADAHYLNADESTVHQVALAIKNDFKLADLRDQIAGFEAHLLNDEEMRDRFLDFPEALENITRITDSCHIEMSFGEYFLPKFVLAENETSDDGLRRLAHEGLQARFLELRPRYGKPFGPNNEKAYAERLEYELSVIINMGFSGYFLIVQDFINWAKSQDIPVGPGRGSGAGSLVAFALRITDIDPIPYNLIFERFLNPERISMPDFDVDFCQERRDEVIQYVTERYGNDHVAQITTFGKMMAKGALRDVGRALGMGYNG